jgi:hypothetical protein
MEKELLGKSTVARRKAARLIGTAPDPEMCSILLKALVVEENSYNSWETLIAIMKAVGHCRCAEFAVHLWERYLVKESTFPLVDLHAATAFVRISRSNNDDSEPVLKLLELGRNLVSEGALEAIGYDKMVPKLEEQDSILRKCWDLGLGRHKGMTDPRYGLAAGCTRWESKLVESFLQHCLTSDDVPLIYVASHALQKKEVRLR